MAATAAHAAFQLTVSALVYPALAATPAEQWSGVHAAHSRRITPVVGVVYLAVVVACVGALVQALSAAVVVAVALSAVALLVTATLAAPLHGRLGSGRRTDLVRRLLVVDRVRTAAAVGALLAALLA